jgi:tetratricopeptide (TPR) repeat protein
MLLSARDICEREGNVLYQIMAARHLGMAQLFLGDLDSAENSLIAARDLAKRRQDREREMFVYSILGPVYLQKGDLSRATELFREQLAFAQLVGREADIALNQANLGNTLMELGRYEEAVEHISAALPIMERVGDRANVSTAQCVLASTYHARGDFESAAEWMKRATALNAEIGARLNETGTRAVLGKIYLEMDRPKLAQHQFHESHRLAVEIGDPTRVRIAQIGMAQTALALGNLATAREQINDVMSDDRWQSAYNPAERAFDIYHVLAALNDARASRKLQQAHDLLQEQADCISDQGYRHSFLHHVPLHRAILNAYAKSADAIGDQSDRID